MRCELSRISCWLWKCFVFNFRLLFFFFFFFVFILTRNPFEFYFAWLLNGNGNPFEWDFDFVLSVEFKLWEFQWISSSPSISLHRKTLFYIVVVVPFYHSLISPSIDEILYIISTGRLFKTSLRLSSTFPPDIFREKKASPAPSGDNSSRASNSGKFSRQIFPTIFQQDNMNFNKICNTQFSSLSGWNW